MKIISGLFALQLLVTLTGMVAQGQTADRSTGKMANGRYDHAAVALPNGMVFVVGGQHERYFGSSSDILGQDWCPDYLSYAELYDPIAEKWTATAPMSTVRMGHSATLVGGKVLVAGGGLGTVVLNLTGHSLIPSGPTNSAEIFDPSSGTWAAAAPMLTKRQYHTATTLRNGLILVTGGFSSNAFLNFSGGANSSELYNPGNNSWTATGSMANGRAAHTAVLLDNGKVLVCGGLVATNNFDVAELYDPATGTWSTTGGGYAPVNRNVESATLLRNGNVLLVGGSYQGTTVTNADLYNTASGTWSATGPLATARGSHTATLMPDGNVLIAGGDIFSIANKSDTTTSSAEVYNYAAGTFSPFNGGTKLSSLRVHHTATVLTNGKLLLAGGTTHYDDTYGDPNWHGSRIHDIALGSAELISFPPAPVTPIAVPLAAARTYHTTTALASGDALVAGGFDGTGYLTSAAVFSAGAQTWLPTGSLNVPRSGHAAAGLFTGKVLVLGGLSTNGIVGSAELFDPASGGWTLTGSLANPRLFPSATVLFDGTVLAVGGSSVGFFGSMASAELYNPTAGTWSTVGALNTARVNHTATLLFTGKVLVTGGYNNGSLATAELYDPVSKTWTTTGAMIFPRDSHTATLLADGTVLVAGGQSNFTAHATAEIYNPVSGTWSLVGGMSVSRSGHTATFLLNDNRVLVTGGNNGAYLTGTELYDPVAQTWSASTPLATGRSLHTATLLGNNRVLLAFGSGTGGGVVSSSEVYNPAKPPMPLTYTTGSEVVLTTNNNFTATGNAVDLTLNFVPKPGTTLKVIKNTGTNFIKGTLAGLTQGQKVTLFYQGVPYDFVANYYGGSSGRDLVLQWADTRLVAWGNNANGQLGDNTTTNRPAPVALPTSVPFFGLNAPTFVNGKTVTRLACGGSHTLALCSDGTLLAWGINAAGQLGNGTNTDSALPLPVTQTGVLAGKTVVAVGAGLFHSVVLCSDGTLAAWGGNSSGQLGNGNNTDSRVPVLVNQSGVLAGRSVVAISAGGSHTLASCADGTLVAWGYNVDGELGNGSFANSNVPVLVNSSGALNGRTITAMAAGFVANVVLCADGTLAAWGYGGGGQLGNGSFTNSSVPVFVDRSGVLNGRTVTDIAAGWYHNVILCADGTLASWGFNPDGELGNGTTAGSAAPVLVDRTGALSNKTVVSITAGAVHSLAQCADGTLVAWGYNGNGQLGDGTTTNRSAPVLVSTTLLKTNDQILKVVSGSYAAHSVAAIASQPTTLVAWTSLNFTNSLDQSNPSISGPLGNPTGDKIPNIVKYALGLDPKQTNSQPLVQTSTSSPGGGGSGAPKYLSMSFSVPEPSPGGANFYLQQVPEAGSTNWVTLATKLSSAPWLAANGGTVQVAPPSSGKVQVTIFSDKPIGGTNVHGFMRLLVELP